MDMLYVVLVFFVIIIILTFTSLVTDTQSDFNNALSTLVIILSLIAIVCVVLSRKKSYYPY